MSLCFNISMHILHTVLYTFSVLVDKENFFNNQELLGHFPYSPDLNL